MGGREGEGLSVVSWPDWLGYETADTRGSLFLLKIDKKRGTQLEHDMPETPGQSHLLICCNILPGVPTSSAFKTTIRTELEILTTTMRDDAPPPDLLDTQLLHQSRDRVKRSPSLEGADFLEILAFEE